MPPSEDPEAPSALSCAGARFSPRGSGQLRMAVLSRPRFRGQPSVHCWLLWPLQVQSWTLVPLAVAAPETSRHSPDWTPVTEPFELTFHCWLVCPLQAQMIAGVPLVVPRPDASRHSV